LLVVTKELMALLAVSIDLEEEDVRGLFAVVVAVVNDN